MMNGSGDGAPPIRLFRITLEEWATSLGGSGVAGRWNSKGRRVVCTSETRSLACLENLVRRGGEGLDGRFVVVTLVVEASAGNAPVEAAPLLASHLDPVPWDDLLHTRAIGDRWLDAGSSLLLRVPSAIIPGECNVLIHPDHPDSGRVRVESVEPFRFDRRL